MSCLVSILKLLWLDLGVSKNRDSPKWMVYVENPIKMDDLGVPLFLETPIYILSQAPQ